MSVAERIIKNTGYLYIKMAITVFITLYTTRLLLEALGASDFGVFNIVGGAISMLGFLNSTLAHATQRFMSYAEGQGDLENKRKIFNVSVVLHVFIAALTVVLLLAVMYPLFNGILNIDEDRIFAAKIVYICLIFSTVLMIINVPYEAVMNSHENMLYYSIVGVLESLLRLGIAFFCVYTKSDKLIMYGILTACVPLITLSVMKIYCHKHYSECVLTPRKCWDKGLVKQIGSYFGWNFLTAMSSLVAGQGNNIVLNHFFGTLLNAAQGVAHQVNSSLSSFSSNMMKALNPVIVKNVGSGNHELMSKATLAGCKFSALLIMLFAIPLSLEIQYVLKIWLKEPPEWTSLFCILILVKTIIIQSAASASTAVYGQGDIKHYAIYKSTTNMLPLVITFLAFYFGGGPVWLYVPTIIIGALGGNYVIIHYAKEKCAIGYRDYIKKVVFPLLATGAVMLIFSLPSVLLLKESFGRLLLSCVSTTLGLLFSCYLFALSQEERNKVKQLVSRRSKRNK